MLAVKSCINYVVPAPMSCFILSFGLLDMKILLVVVTYDIVNNIVNKGKLDKSGC